MDTYIYIHIIHTRWCPPIISWFIIPITIEYIPLINPSEIVLINQLNANYAAPPCTSIHPYIHTYIHTSIHANIQTYLKELMIHMRWMSSHWFRGGDRWSLQQCLRRRSVMAREKGGLLFGVVNKNEVYIYMYEIDMCISFYILKNSLQSTISWTMAGMINNQQKTYIHTCVCVYIYIYNMNLGRVW